MKVCFISYYAYRLFHETSRITFGGNELLYFLMAKELVKDKRFSVCFLLEGGTSQETRGGIKLYKTSREEGLTPEKNKTLDFFAKVYCRIAERFNSLWLLPHKDFFRLGQALGSINADIYIQGSATYEIGLMVLWCKLLKKQSIFMVGHDDDLDKTYVKERPFGKLYEWGLTHANHICCTSIRHQKMLKQNYGRNSTYIPYWFPPQKIILPLKKRDHILWIARLDPWKNPEALFRLARSLSQLKFTFVAALSRTNSEYFKKIIDRGRKIPNLTIKTNLSFSQAVREYRSACLFLDTSDYGSLHTSHLMAAAAGTPAVTLFKDPNSSFQEYGWGSTANGHFASFRKLAEMIVNQPSTWKKMSKNALRFSRTVHDLDDQVNKFKQMLLNLTPAVTTE